MHSDRLGRGPIATDNSRDLDQNRPGSPRGSGCPHRIARARQRPARQGGANGFSAAVVVRLRRRQNRPARRRASDLPDAPLCAHRPDLRSDFRRRPVATAQPCFDLVPHRRRRISDPVRLFRLGLYGTEPWRFRWDRRGDRLLAAPSGRARGAMVARGRVGFRRWVGLLLGAAGEIPSSWRAVVPPSLNAGLLLCSDRPSEWLARPSTRSALPPTRTL